MMREEVRDGLVNHPSSQHVSMVAMPITENEEQPDFDPDFGPPENEEENGPTAAAAAAADGGDAEGEGEGEEVAR